MTDARTIRLYRPIKNKLAAICRETGMDNKRAVAACVEGWDMLGGMDHARAVADSISTPTDASPLPIRVDTHERLQALVATHTGPQARMVDALVNGWHMLDHEQRRQAIVASAPPEPENAAPN